jgi:signal transduction histidine kinase
MFFNSVSLRKRIFIAMIFLVVISSVLIAAITIIQYNEQAREYHENRLERKETAIKSALTYELFRNKSIQPDTITNNNLLTQKINEISDIHNLDVHIYNLHGELLRSSSHIKGADKKLKLSNKIVRKIAFDRGHRVVEYDDEEASHYVSAYSYLYNMNSIPVAIIGIPYLQDNTLQDKELKEFLQRLMLVYLLILFLAIITAFFLSKYITKTIEYVSEKLKSTNFGSKNDKIILKNTNDSIYALVSSYNNMIDQLEASALSLAESERKQAWQEMARQVAHEIKNPLTPMRLTIQSFERDFDPKDPDIRKKVVEFREILLQQIDTMSSIASAFSSFAQMPVQNKETLDVVHEVKLSLNLFRESYIHFYPEKDSIYADLDKVQLNRIITNLMTNAIQAVQKQDNPNISVHIRETENDVTISVLDNGEGIAESDTMKIFEPKFTTKNSGMGLGLAMVKKIVETYNGSITVNSSPNEGAAFLIRFPKH